MSNGSDHLPPAPTLPRVRRSLGVHPNYLDVMCCLVLVYLMTSLLADTSQRVQEQTLPPIALAQLPGDSAQPLKESSPFILTVKPGPVYFAGDRTVPLASLADSLREVRPAEVEIRGDAASTYVDVMNAMQACHETGVTQVVLTYQVKQ
jgi:biopolymer transport protein ExbD